MRLMIVGLMLLAAASASVAQESIKLAPNFRIGPAAPCRGADLSIRLVTSDAAMGGHNLAEFAFKNNSASACTLKGYPRFELLSKTGGLLPKGRAINSKALPGDDAQGAPQLITLAAGKEGMFRVYYNNGGAGHVGKPCPTSRKVRIMAPGTTRAFMLNERLTSCGTVQVSAVRTSTNLD